MCRVLAKKMFIMNVFIDNLYLLSSFFIWYGVVVDVVVVLVDNILVV